MLLFLLVVNNHGILMLLIFQRDHTGTSYGAVSVNFSDNSENINILQVHTHTKSTAVFMRHKQKLKIVTLSMF